MLADDAWRRRAMIAVRDAGPPAGWIGAGFVRDAVWDRLHGRAPAPPAGDVDVLWYAPGEGAGRDATAEAMLSAACPGVDWSVKNQARMHGRNGDAPYSDVTDAMRHWPETATAVAVRLTAAGMVEVAAPYGLDDLFAGVVRPTARFAADRRAIFDARVTGKGWLARYPLLRIVAA